jgi:hypothetical protein
MSKMVCLSIRVYKLGENFQGGLFGILTCSLLLLALQVLKLFEVVPPILLAGGKVSLES